MNPQFAKPILKVGSRESPLALAQSEHVIALLKARHPDLQAEIVTFKTQGDIRLDTALSKVGDKGLFVKELETALLAGEIDLAVHSMKDMPSALPEGLALVSAGEREDPRDVLISTAGNFAALPAGAKVGTSSLRREAQLRRLRNDLDYTVIRGNLQTRLRKLEEGQYAAIVLAAAGVHRLGWRDKVTQYFDVLRESLPAVSQGILGVEYRAEDEAIFDLLDGLRVHAVEVAQRSERAVLAALEGGCQLPLAAHCVYGENEIRLHAAVFSPDGTQAVRADLHVDDRDPVAAGTALGAELLDMGAREILAVIRAAESP